MKLLILNFDGQRVVTSSITNASKIALRHFGQLYCELMILEKIQKYYLLVNTHTELLLVNQHTDIFENRTIILSTSLSSHELEAIALKPYRSRGDKLYKMQKSTQKYLPGL